MNLTSHSQQTDALPTVLLRQLIIIGFVSVSEWFPVNVGLRHGCVLSPWLFNVYMDGVVREVNVRVLGKGWSC